MDTHDPPHPHHTRHDANRAEDAAARAPHTICDTLANEIDGLFRFAMARLRNAHAAEDAVQQTLLIAIDHPQPPAAADDQRAWARGILRNVLHRFHRNHYRRRNALTKLHQQSSPADESTTAESLTKHEWQQRQIELLTLAVTQLDRDDQDLFFAYYREGRSHKAIAQQLDTTPKSIESRLYRLRARLRQSLDEYQECFP